MAFWLSFFPCQGSEQTRPLQHWGSSPHGSLLRLQDSSHLSSTGPQPFPSSHTVKPTYPFLICCNDFLLSLFMPLVAQMVKNLPAMWETWVQSLGWEGSPGEGNGNPLQHPCLENSMDRETWQAIVCEVPKSQT